MEVESSVLLQWRDVACASLESTDQAFKEISNRHV